VRDNTFHAELILDHNTRVSARVSDAIALALHLDVPIHAEDTVLDAAAIAHTTLRAEGDHHAPDDVESSAGSSTPPPPTTSTRTDADLLMPGTPGDDSTVPDALGDLDDRR
jgi:hypothetical protein